MADSPIPTNTPPHSDIHGAPAVTDRDFGDAEIVAVLESYRREAEENRRTGWNSRDEKWEQNADLYWNRYDFSRKASWQAREVMPEVPAFVDRFSGALKEALMSTTSFYTVSHPADKEGDLSGSIKRMTDVWLSQTGRDPHGTMLPFAATFEEQMKMGAIMACASVTTWKEDVPNGRVAIETVDPQKVWLDHTGRNLYRMRRVEMDRHALHELAEAKDGKGRPIFKLPEVERLVASLYLEDQAKREAITGEGQQVSTTRAPIVLDEYIATVVDNDGKKVADRGLFVVANGQYLIRGPEKNPFWHNKDWLLYAPLVVSPLSVYGRSYMEDFGSLAKTFNELTNLILDAVHVSSMNALAVVPSMLSNPEQLAEGVSPSKTYFLEEGFRAEDFSKVLELGTVSPESVKIWEAIKRELTEAADLNEIGLGQFAPKGRTSVGEINAVQQSSSALIRSVAQTVESRFLDPQLDLTWKTGLQHVRPGDAALMAAAGETMYQTLLAQRKDFIKAPFTFQARGISSMIARSQELKMLLQILQIVASSDILMQELMAKISVEKLFKRLFILGNVDITTIEISERERQLRQFAEQMQPAMAAGAGASPTGSAASAATEGIARTQGIAR